MQITVKADTKRLSANLKRIHRRQIPYATSVALNKTAKRLVTAEQKQMRAKLDRPTPQTIKAVRIFQYAKKTALTARVGFLSWANDYMQYQVHGGTRPIKKKYNSVPSVHRKLNAYGNIPGKKTGIIKAKDFKATIGGKTAIWKRTGRKGNKKLVPQVWLDTKAPQYKKRFPFYRIAEGVVKNVYHREFTKSLRHAVRTAR